MASPDAFQKSKLAPFDYQDPRIWGFPHHRRAIMASLVKGVYRMEKDRAKGLWKHANQKEGLKTPQWWQAFYYEMVRPLQDGDEVIGAVYHSHLDHHYYPKVYGESSVQGAPKIVVALRGTMISKIDFDADAYIFFHQLSGHNEFPMVLQVIREQVNRFGPGSVCLAGHSKGAVLAILAGRQLAQEGCYLEAHLFNPPNPSLPTQPLHLSPAATLAVGLAHNIAANTVAHVLLDAKTRNRERNEFLSLHDWLPNLYINTHDLLCSSYIQHFEVSTQLPQLKETWFGPIVSRTPRSIRGTVMFSLGRHPNCRPDHLIPSATLHITDVASSLYAAHKLGQWLNLDLRTSPMVYKLHA